MTKRTNIKHRHGFTLTELAIVLGVIGTIVSAIWWAASNAQELQKENDAFNELQIVVQNMDALMQGQTFSQTSGTNITSAMLDASVIPSTYASSQNVAGCSAAKTCMADNPWHPTDFMIYTNLTRGYYIEYDQVSEKGCVALMSQATSCQSGQSACPIQVYTAGGTSDSVSPGVATGATAPTATNITTYCAANSYTGGTNYVKIFYGL